MRDADKRHRCKRINTLCEQDDIECFRKPSSFSFNFIAMVPNMTLPVNGMALFNLQTTVGQGSLDFDLKIINVHAPDHVKRADDYYFK